MTTRGVKFLDVAKLPNESESFAWYLTALLFRSGAEGWVHADAGLAAVASLSPRTSRRCRQQAIDSGFCIENDGRLTLDRSRFRKRYAELREGRCAVVRVHADMLREPNLTALDRRIIAWVQSRGRGVDRGGARFVLSSELIAQDLGINRASLHRRIKVLGARLQAGWRRCADGRMRRTYWAQRPECNTTENHATRGQNATPGRPECDIAQRPECNTTENRARPECDTTVEPYGRTTTTGAHENAVDHHDHGGGDRSADRQQEKPDTVRQAAGDAIASATPSASPSPEIVQHAPQQAAVKPRAFLDTFRAEDARRTFLVHDREQIEKVLDLLVGVDFAVGNQERHHATANAIVNRHGDAAARWLLDVLLGIAADPTTDVAAVLAHRFKNGLLNQPDVAPPTSGPSWRSRSSSSVSHIHNMPLGTPSCSCSDCVSFREKPGSQGKKVIDDSEGWLRDIVGTRVFGDHAPVEQVAEELDLPLAEVEVIVAEIKEREPRQSRFKIVQGDRKPQVGKQQKAEHREKLIALYRETGRKPPSHVMEALR